MLKIDFYNNVVNNYKTMSMNHSEYYEDLKEEEREEKEKKRISGHPPAKKSYDHLLYNEYSK